MRILLWFLLIVGSLLTIPGSPGEPPGLAIIGLAGGCVAIVSAIGLYLLDRKSHHGKPPEA